MPEQPEADPIVDACLSGQVRRVSAGVLGGTSNAIAVLEVENSGIHWMEPRDLDIGQALRGVNSPAGLCIRSHHPGGAGVAMCDGSVHFLPDTISPKSLKALLTAHGKDTPGGNW